MASPDPALPEGTGAPTTDCGGIIDGASVTRESLVARGMSGADADKVLAFAARLAEPEIKPGEPFTVVCGCGARRSIVIDPTEQGWVVGLDHRCRATPPAARPEPEPASAPPVLDEARLREIEQRWTNPTGKMWSGDVAELAAAYRAVCAERAELRTRLLASNELLRSCHEVAKREERQPRTNWPALRARLADELKEQHAMTNVIRAALSPPAPGAHPPTPEVP